MQPIHTHETTTSNYQAQAPAKQHHHYTVTCSNPKINTQRHYQPPHHTNSYIALPTAQNRDLNFTAQKPTANPPPTTSKKRDLSITPSCSPKHTTPTTHFRSQQSPTTHNP
jgi:hypothetical protein